MLKFSRNNSKLGKTAQLLGIPKSKIAAFDLPAGWTCPGADECLARADRSTGKITDGKDMRYRCYAASLEAAFPTSRRSRWHNFDLLVAARTMARMRDLIQDSLPNVQYVRIHSSGDFFNKKYFDAWIQVAQNNPDITFYGYTKRADLLEGATLPDNMIIVVSAGGKYDDCAINHPRAHVVYSDNGHDFPVYDDAQSELAVLNNQTFGLLIHGTQPKAINEAIKNAQ